MSQTISGYFSNPIVLGDGGAYASPTTISATVQAGGRNDVLIANPWVVTLTGELLAPANSGNLVEADGYLSFDNLGRIADGGSGINLYQGGAISNSGAISGYKYAIDAYAGGQNGTATPFFNVTNSGYLGATGAAGHGIFGGPGLVTNTGTVFGGEFGILDVSTVVNDGTLLATDFAVGFTPGGTLENQAHGVITGGLFAVYGSRGVSTTLANAGYIIGGNYAGVKLGYGYAGNTGTIESVIGEAVYFSGAASLNNAGLIESQDAGGTGVSLANGGAVTNTGTITGFSGIVLDGGTLVNDGLIQGATRNNNGGGLSAGINATAIDFIAAGTLIEEGAGIVLGSVIGDGGTLVMEGGSLAQVNGFAADIFAGPDATLATDLAGLGVVSGFAGQDALILSGQSASFGSFYGHGLTLSDGAVVDFAGSYGVHQLVVTADPADGTDISAACFLAGTRIATPGGEVAVERLRAGELVRTVHAGARPVKWIGRRRYEAPFCNQPAVLPVRIAAGALGRGVPVRDLWVSPGHAVWVAGALAPAGRLVNGTSIAQALWAARVEYYHIELETHELLMAEGCPAESLLAEGFYGLFQNAPPALSLGWGLPRVEGGFWLRAAQDRLGVAASGGCGRLVGFVDAIAPCWVAGWAQDVAAPEEPVALDILAGGRRVARVLANAHRADLRRAGVGSGNHGFSVRLPGDARVDAVVRARDGAVLRLSRECAAAAA